MYYIRSRIVVQSDKYRFLRYGDTGGQTGQTFLSFFLDVSPVVSVEAAKTRRVPRVVLNPCRKPWPAHGFGVPNAVAPLADRFALVAYSMFTSTHAFLAIFK